MKTKEHHNPVCFSPSSIMSAVLIMLTAAFFTFHASAAHAQDDTTEINNSGAGTLHGSTSSTDGLSLGKNIRFIFSIEHINNTEHDDYAMRNEAADIDRSADFKSSLKKIVSGPELPPVINEAVQITKAFVTNFVLHELGHRVIADHAGATNTRFDFLKKDNGAFFLGQSTFDRIDDESKLSFSMAGEAAADLTFEHALRNFRNDPTLYNKSVLFFSGTDFLWYCLYAFYLSDGHPHFDPVAISQRTGLSEDTIFMVALSKTVINTYRVYSGNDYVIPYFSVNKKTATLNFMITF